MDLIKKYFYITLGSLVFAVGFALFLSPQNIAPGGVSGIAVIITHFFPNISNGTVILLLNIPLLIAGTAIFGLRFLFGTVWASFLLSAFVSVIEYLIPNPPSSDLFCCALSGGIIMGTGIGLVFRQNVTTGGTDIAVKILQRKMPHIKTGIIFLIIDSFIVILSGIVFGNIDTLIYSGFALCVSTLSFNYILYGGMRAKLVIIIDSDVSHLAKTMSEEAGVTVIKGIGAYSGEKKIVMICAVDKRKYPVIMTIVKKTSPESVVITAPAESFIHGHSIV
ncbi:MAG: YitT family protein [Ruminococcaceae bacterium]|nr:YitT family protein [Oscillospiraceae bacterium]